ncbi:hypothetical protein B0T25DRAFT_87438 [Lasiosphaeria hispida]|uniref:Uncharacterized protein n=1 Tax=Lasiosphaeria hispida TaxID=260671 RepID=A0AAJ0HPT7_9PEZI|nr:hypothetical protein B0T25DRAFT_87438 [Lasiosphaeria hispida]
MHACMFCFTVAVRCARSSLAVLWIGYPLIVVVVTTGREVRSHPHLWYPRLPRVPSHNPPDCYSYSYSCHCCSPWPITRRIGYTAMNPGNNTTAIAHAPRPGSSKEKKHNDANKTFMLFFASRGLGIENLSPC